MPLWLDEVESVFNIAGSDDDTYAIVSELGLHP